MACHQPSSASEPPGPRSVYIPPLCAQSSLPQLPDGHDAPLPLYRCLQSGTRPSLTPSPFPRSHPPHSSPTTPSTGTSPRPRSPSWPQYSPSPRFGPSSSSPTLPPHCRPSLSPSPYTLPSLASPSRLTAYPPSTLSHHFQAPPSASLRSGGGSGKPTRAGITCVSTNCTRSTAQSLESVQTSCPSRTPLQSPSF